MHGEKNDRGGAIKAPPPMGLGLILRLVHRFIDFFFFLLMALTAASYLTEGKGNL